MIALCSFLRDVTVGSLAGIVSGAVVLGIGYWLVEKRLRLQDRVERRTDADRRRRAALDAVRMELITNAGMLSETRGALSQERTPFPLFSTSTLRAAFEPVIFDTLSPETISALLHVRDRAESANKLHEIIFDVSAGGSYFVGILATGPDQAAVWKEVDEHIGKLRSALVQRLDDLEPRLNAAIDAVEGELGLGLRPAAEREFRLSTVGRVGWVEEQPSQTEATD